VEEHAGPGSTDITILNTRWLQAWTDQNIPALLEFYHPDVFYRDPQVPSGIHGHMRLAERLSKLFQGSRMSYEPRRVWVAEDGYFGVWIGRGEQADGTETLIRGLDYCKLKDGRIIHNDVYVHQLGKVREPPIF
jgi:hypothetical protein